MVADYWSGGKYRCRGSTIALIRQTVERYMVIKNISKRFAVRTGYGELWNNSHARELDSIELMMVTEFRDWLETYDCEWWDSSLCKELGTPRELI
jgi:hypothetical protein